MQQATGVYATEGMPLTYRMVQLQGAGLPHGLNQIWTPGVADQRRTLAARPKDLESLQTWFQKWQNMGGPYHPRVRQWVTQLRNLCRRTLFG
jgi:hypothetical protein